MNGFLKRISFTNSYQRRALSPPIEASFEVQCTPEFVRHRLQTRYDLKFHFNQEVWIDGNKEDDSWFLMETKKRFIKAVQSFIFGDTEKALHELEMHLHNQDFEKAMACLRVAKLTIDGDRCE